MKNLSCKLLTLAALMVGLSLPVKAEQVNLNSALIAALEKKDAEILSTLGLNGHTIHSITYADSQGFGGGNIMYPGGYQLVPTPVATLEQWDAMCSPGTAVIDQESSQSVQEGSTYANTNTTSESVVIEVDASASYGVAKLDVNTTTSFDASDTTTTTKTSQNIKAVAIKLDSTREFSCQDKGPFFMHGYGTINNNITQTLSGDTNIPYTYDVFPNGDVITVTTKSPFVTTTVPGASVRVVLWNRDGNQVWDSTDNANPSDPNNHQYYSGNSNFPDKEDIKHILVSTGTNYGVTANVWVCKDNNDCLIMNKDDNYISYKSEYAKGNINSLIVENRDTTTTTTGGELTNHTMKISDFLGLNYTIATLTGIYSAQAIDNLTSSGEYHTYEYDTLNVPAEQLAMCGATIEEAQDAYQQSCNQCDGKPQLKWSTNREVISLKGIWCCHGLVPVSFEQCLL